MKLLDRLKFIWDPRTAEEKAYSKWNRETPLQRRTQHMKVYVKGIAEPFDRVYTQEDRRVGSLDIVFRDASEESFGYNLHDWLESRGNTGIRLGSTWYFPDMVERIELLDQTVEDIE